MRHEPIAIPTICPSWCHCTRCTPAARPLVQRFADAAEPGDFAALWLGTKLGLGLIVIVAIADNWSAIVAFVGGVL